MLRPRSGWADPPGPPDSRGSYAAAVILGGYGDHGDTMPRFVTVTITRPARRTPKAGSAQPFLVRLHEEGTCLTWQHDVLLSAEREAALLADQVRLDRWATVGGGDVPATLATVERFGRSRFDTFVGASNESDFRGLLAEELSTLQRALTAKTANVTTILDCCHSGGPGGLRTTGTREGSGVMIYGLFVGIDAYRSPVPPLFGCRNDVEALSALISRRAPDAHLKTLVDANATRQAIIDAFGSHLALAGRGDHAVFGFSGHGSQELTPLELAGREPDGLNETLVCADSRHDGVPDLSVLIARAAAVAGALTRRSLAGVRDTPFDGFSLRVDDLSLPDEPVVVHASSLGVADRTVVSLQDVDTGRVVRRRTVKVRREATFRAELPPVAAGVYRVRVEAADPALGMKPVRDLITVVGAEEAAATGG